MNRPPLPADIRRVQRVSLWIAILGLGLCFLNAFFAPERSAFAYLFGWTCWLAVVLGALMMVMIGHTTSASWFLPMRRVAESVALTLPLLALLFLPILIGRARLFPWAQPLEQLSDPLREAVLAKPGYLGTPFFIVRAVIYFGFWIATAALLASWSVRQDGRSDRLFARRQRVLAAVGLPPVAFALTFASFDWILSLDPRWISTMFGIYYFAGGMVAALGTIGLLTFLLQRTGMLMEVTISHFHALGKLLLTFVIFWGYVAYAQFFIIWIADIPKEAGWFIPRLQDGWGWIAALLAVAHFGVPFLLLLSWGLKRRPRALAGVGAWVLFAHIVDLYWLVIPALEPVRAAPHWVDFAALFGIGAALLAAAIWRFEQHLPAPVGDPLWPKALEYTTR